MKQHFNQLRGSMLLLLTSMIWGAAFVAQSAGMDYIGPFTFNGLRMLMGAAVLLPFCSSAAPEPPPHPNEKRS